VLPFNEESSVAVEYGTYYFEGMCRFDVWRAFRSVSRWLNRAVYYLLYFIAVFSDGDQTR